MVGWLDCLPNAVPVLSLIVAALSFLFSCHTAWRQHNHSKSERRWDEYKETVYDPVRKEVDELRRLARECRHWSTFGPKQEDALKLLGALSFQLEEVRIACKDADSHESTKEKDWDRFAEEAIEKINDFIAEHDPLSLATDADGGLNQEIQDYISQLDKRLRSQREAMT